MSIIYDNALRLSHTLGTLGYSIEMVLAAGLSDSYDEGGCELPVFETGVMLLSAA